MRPDLHLVRTRPPILDVPPLVWIEPPGMSKTHAPTWPVWEVPKPPPARDWRPPLRLALAVLGVAAFSWAATVIAIVSEPAGPAPSSLPVAGEPIYCACTWWPTKPAASLTG